MLAFCWQGIFQRNHGYKTVFAVAIVPAVYILYCFDFFLCASPTWETFRKTEPYGRGGFSRPLWVI